MILNFFDWLSPDRGKFGLEPTQKRTFNLLNFCYFFDFDLGYFIKYRN